MTVIGVVLVIATVFILGWAWWISGFDGLAGGAALFAHRDEGPGGSVLNVTATIAEAPALADLLDRAALEGSASTKTDVARSWAYLDKIAQASGSAEFGDTDFRVRWHGQSFVIGRVES